jgi:hypothetical protein
LEFLPKCFGDNPTQIASSDALPSHALLLLTNDYSCNRADVV